MEATLYKLNTNSFNLDSLIEKLKEDNTFLSIFDKKVNEEKASLLLKMIFLKKLNKRLSDLRFNQYGAPIIDGVNFSISHASGLIILVESNEKIGIDTLDKRKTNEGVVKKYFSPNEINYLNKATTLKEKDELFTFIWSLKEALGKYYGIGITKSAAEYGLELNNNLLVNYKTKENFKFLKTSVENQFVTIVSKNEISKLNVIDINEKMIEDFLLNLDESIL